MSSASSSPTQTKTPFALILLKLPYDAAVLLRKLFSILFAFPIHLFVASTDGFVNHKSFKTGDLGFYLLFFFWRWLLSIVFPALAGTIFLLPALCILAYAKLAQPTTQLQYFSPLFSISSTVPLAIYLVVYGTKRYFSKLSYKQYISSLLYSQVDMFSMLCTLVVIAGVVRINKLVRYMNTYAQQKEKYAIFILKQVAFTFIDILCIPFVLLLLVTMIRVRYTWSVIKDEPSDFLARETIVIQSVLSVVEWIVHLVFGIPVLLTVYRLPSLASKLKNAQLPNDRILHTLDECFKVLGDLPFIALGIIVLCSGIRTISFINALKRKSHWRIVALQYFGKLLLDFPCAVFGAVLLVTVYRFPRVISRIRTIKPEDSEFRAHQIVLFEFLGLIVDIPFILFGIVVNLSIWRLVPFWRKFSQSKKIMDKRMTAFNQFCYLFVDIPAFLCFVVTLVTIWRTRSLLKAVFGKDDDAENSTDSSTEHQGSENDLKLHNAVFAESSLLLRDLPYIVMFLLTSILTPWRLPYMLKHMSKDDYDEKILQECLLVPLDYLAGVAGIFTLVTLWRAKSLIEKVKTVKDYHSSALLLAVTGELLELLEDLPFAIPLVLIALNPYRAWKFYKSLKAIDEDEGVKNKSREKRITLLQLGVKAVIDIPSIILLVPLLISWRSKRVIMRIKAEKDLKFLSILEEFMKLLISIVFLILSPLTLWRFPYVAYNIMFVLKRYERRKFILDQLNELVQDIPFVPSILLCWITVYRVKPARREVDKFKSSWRLVYFFHSVMIPLDLLLALSSLILMLSVWRTSYTIQMYKAQRTFLTVDKEQDVYSLTGRMNLHSQIYQQLIMLIFLDIPCLIPVAILCAGFWRIPTTKNMVTKSYEKKETHLKRREVLCKQAFFALVDIFAMIAFTIVALTWRHFTIRRRIKHETSMENFTLHLVVFGEFINLLIDIIYIILSVGTVWRLPVVIYKTFWVHSNADSRRSEVLVQLREFIIDIPYTPFIPLNLLSFWRIPKLYARMADKNELDKRGNWIYFPFLGLMDVICVLLLIILTFTWRSYTTYRVLLKLRRKKRRNPNLWVTSKWNVPLPWHDKIVAQFLELMLDIPCFPLFLILTLTVWRMPALVRRIRRLRQETQSHDIRLEIYAHFFYLLIDIPCFLLGLIVLVSWQSPSMLYQLYITRNSVAPLMWNEVVVQKFSFLIVEALVLVPQILFIILTLTELPTFLIRTKIFMQYYMKDKDSLYSKFKQMFKATFQSRQSASGNQSEFSEVPIELKSMMAEYLDVEDLVKIERINKEFAGLSHDIDLWKGLYFRKQPSAPKPSMISLKRYKDQLVKDAKMKYYQTRHPLMLTYLRGYSELVSEECGHAFRQIPHLLVTPLKLLGLVTFAIKHIILIPIIRALFPASMMIQHATVTAAAPFLRFLHTDLIKLSYEPWKFQNMKRTFWSLHIYFFADIGCMILFLWHLGFMAIGILGYCILFVVTVGYPVWNSAVQKLQAANNHHSAARLLKIITPIRIVLEGVTLPFIAILGFDIAAFPLWVCGMQLNPISWMIVRYLFGLPAIDTPYLYTSNAAAWLLRQICNSLPLISTLAEWIRTREPYSLPRIIAFIIKTPVLLIPAFLLEVTYAQQLYNGADMIDRIIRNLFPVYEPTELYRIIRSTAIAIRDYVHGKYISYRDAAYRRWLVVRGYIVRALKYVERQVIKVCNFFYEVAAYVLNKVYQAIKFIVNDIILNFLKFVYRIIYNVLSFVWNIVFGIVKKVVSIVVEFVTMVWSLYRRFLEGATEACYKMDLLGNILHTFIVFTWMFWPIFTPALLFRSLEQYKYLYIPTGMLCLFFLFKGWYIVKENWCEPVADNAAPALELISFEATSDTCNEHGINFLIKAKKPRDFAIRSAKLYLEGDSFWKVLEQVAGSAIISIFKYTLYPIDLVPTFMHAEDIKEGEETVSFVIQIGTGMTPTEIKNFNKTTNPLGYGNGGFRLSRKTLTEKLQVIVDKGDPELTLKVIGIHKSKQQKFLLFKATTRPSVLMKKKQE